MALKDWKKTGPNIWKGKKSSLYILQNHPYKIWRLEERSGLLGRIIKQFDSRKDAIKFARSYMRSH